MQKKIISQYFGISTAWVVSGGVLIIGALIVMRNGNHASKCNGIDRLE